MRAIGVGFSIVLAFCFFLPLCASVCGDRTVTHSGGAWDNDPPKSEAVQPAQEQPTHPQPDCTKVAEHLARSAGEEAWKMTYLQCSNWSSSTAECAMAHAKSHLWQCRAVDADRPSVEVLFDYFHQNF